MELNAEKLLRNLAQKHIKNISAHITTPITRQHQQSTNRILNDGRYNPKMVPPHGVMPSIRQNQQGDEPKTNEYDPNVIRPLPAPRGGAPRSNSSRPISNQSVWL